MGRLYLSNRLDHFYRIGGKCPACGDTDQQQVWQWWSAPAQWRCRMCRTAYEYEPAGTPVGGYEWDSV